MNIVDPRSGRELELPSPLYRQGLHPSLLSLDVATHYMGYALFDVVDKRTAELCVYGTMKASDKRPAEVRCCEMTWMVAKVLKAYNPASLCLEFPTFQDGPTGNAAARGGDTLLLAYLCGKLSEMWGTYMSRIWVVSQGRVSLNPPSMITFRQWAGQVPKRVTCARLKEYLGVDAKPGSVEDNYADAIMMGVWHLKDEVKREVVPAKNAEEINLSPPSVCPSGSPTT